MAFKPGDVVFLKSGGQPMTVAAVDEDTIECLWIGEEGELFRETIPSVVLTAAPEEEEEKRRERKRRKKKRRTRRTKTSAARPERMLDNPPYARRTAGAAAARLNDAPRGPRGKVAASEHHAHRRNQHQRLPIPPRHSLSGRRPHRLRRRQRRRKDQSLSRTGIAAGSGGWHARARACLRRPH